jgi:hypothetical protein
LKKELVSRTTAGERGRPREDENVMSGTPSALSEILKALQPLDDTPPSGPTGGGTD